MEKKYLISMALITFLFLTTNAIDDLGTDSPKDAVKLEAEVKSLFSLHAGLKLHRFEHDDQELIWGYTQNGKEWVSCMFNKLENKYFCKLDHIATDANGKNYKQVWRILESDKLFKKLKKEYTKRKSKI